MDPTEEFRRLAVAEINKEEADRARLEETYGQVWDTKQLQEEFKVHGFLAPFVHVTRKEDGVEGSLVFQHLPRFYFSFELDKK